MKPVDLKDVYRLHEALAVHWKGIGEKLRIVDPNFFTELDELRSDRTKFRKVVREWKEKETSEVSWENFTEVLNSLGLNDVAKSIEKEFIDS